MQGGRGEVIHTVRRPITSKGMVQLAPNTYGSPFVLRAFLSAPCQPINASFPVYGAFWRVYAVNVDPALYRVPRFIRWREIFRGGFECCAHSSIRVNFGRAILARRGSRIDQCENVGGKITGCVIWRIEFFLSHESKFQISFTERFNEGIRRNNHREATIASLPWNQNFQTPSSPSIIAFGNHRDHSFETETISNFLAILGFTISKTLSFEDV